MAPRAGLKPIESRGSLCLSSRQDDVAEGYLGTESYMEALAVSLLPARVTAVEPWRRTGVAIEPPDRWASCLTEEEDDAADDEEDDEDCTKAVRGEDTPTRPPWP